jgi:hypothetical protein
MWKTTAVSTCKFAIRAFVIYPALGSLDPTFDNDLSIGWNREIVSLALYDLGRISVEPTKNVPVIYSWEREHGRYLVQSGPTDDHGCGHVLTKRLILLGDNPGVVAIVAHIHVGLVLGSVHQAIHTPIDQTGIRVAGD